MDDVVSGHELDHLAADLLGKSAYQLPLPVDVSGVADDAAQTRSAGLGELLDALADVVGGIKSHHLPGGHDVDLLGLSFPDGHGEAAADHIAQDVIEDVVEVWGVGSQVLKEADGGDYPATCTAHSRFRASGLDAANASKAGLQYVIQLYFTLLSKGIQNGRLPLAVHEHLHGVCFGVAAYLHDLLAHGREGCCEILGGGRLADSAFAVNGYLPHITPEFI